MTSHSCDVMISAPGRGVRARLITVEPSSFQFGKSYSDAMGGTIHKIRQ